jgi:hypothetical protein
MMLNSQLQFVVSLPAKLGRTLSSQFGGLPVLSPQNKKPASVPSTSTSWEEAEETDSSTTSLCWDFSVDNGARAWLETLLKIQQVKLTETQAVIRLYKARVKKRQVGGSTTEEVDLMNSFSEAMESLEEQKEQVNQTVCTLRDLIIEIISSDKPDYEAKLTLSRACFKEFTSKFEIVEFLESLLMKHEAEKMGKERTIRFLNEKTYAQGGLYCKSKF